jgi:hypothetical protein
VLPLLPLLLVLLARRQAHTPPNPRFSSAITLWRLLRLLPLMAEAEADNYELRACGRAASLGAPALKDSDTHHLQQLLLEGIANGTVREGGDVARLLCCTFAAHQQVGREGTAGGGGAPELGAVRW